MKKIISLFLILIMSFVVSGCTNTTTTTTETKTTTETEVSYLTVTTKSANLFVGDTKIINYSLNGSSDFTIKFKSSNSEVASVSAGGYIKATGKGTCIITVTYGTETAEIPVTVEEEASFTIPNKTFYTLNSKIDLTGGLITIYPGKDNEKKISLTDATITGFDSTTLGAKTITVTYDKYTFTYSITIVKVLNPDAYKFKDVSITGLTQNVTSEIKIEPTDSATLMSQIASPYDYTEFEIYFTFTSPSGESDTVYAFYTQDYKESHTFKTLNTSLNNEGTINIKEGYNYQTVLTKTGDKYYCLRYSPSEMGEYTYTMYGVCNENDVVYEKSGSFTVSSGEATKGTISVSSNNVSFEFEDGSTYLPVGTNLAWYTSQERRYNDYTLWLEGLEDGGINYIRYWLAAWNGCLFWDNIEDYSTRLDEAFEVDKILDMMGNAGIYVDLTILHHGMFCTTVNPMWKGSSNTWYTAKYGYNPYSDVISSPGQFFTDSYCIKWFENYLKYIVARWGSNDAIMSYELVNEVEWIEEFNQTDGKAWTDTMAKYLKKIDYKSRMVTMSVKGYPTDTIPKALYSLSSIDYINFHYYGNQNFLTYIPTMAPTVLSAFKKPAMLQECNWDGSGGSGQYTSDKEATSLHTELWGGIMSLGSGGMPWWWESWLEKYDVWSEFKGASTYASLLDLSGSYTDVLYSSNVTLTGSSYARKLGYLFNDRCYIYLFDSRFKVSSTGNSNITTTVKVNGLDNGNYTVKFYNTYTGELISTKSVSVTDKTLSFSATFSDDVALTITK